MRRITLSLISMILVAPVFAKTMDTPPYVLKPITVKPKSVNSVLMYDLPKGGMFDIKCDIRNPNYAKQYPVIINVTVEGMMYPESGGNKVIINGRDTKQAALRNEVNTLEIPNSTKLDMMSEIHFQNFDSSDSVYVENCIANWVE